MIEEAGRGDVQEVLSVINTSNREAYRGVIPGEHFREPVLSLEKLLENFGQMTFYVYRSESRIVGVAALHAEDGETGRIRWVYVLPAYQRRGIGTALVTYLERKSREMGLKRMRLLTVGGADWAVSFYKKLGYELADRIARPWGFDVFMEKALRSRVVGIVSSPRKGMNTDTLVTKALEGAQSAGAETAKIYLNDLEIRPCQACDRAPAPGYCFYEDGMETIYKVLETVDVLVIGSPAYHESVSAQLKLLIDRSNCLTARISLPDGKVTFRSRIEKRKKGAFIWVADFSRNPEHALATIRLWCKDANVELVEMLTVTDADRGKGARRREDLLRRAFELGVSLAQG
jgi:multimeric flavodoxin WrbA/GNAT superfamily N-acetyltransferase